MFSTIGRTLGGPRWPVCAPFFDPKNPYEKKLFGGPFLRHIDYLGGPNMGVLGGGQEVNVRVGLCRLSVQVARVRRESRCPISLIQGAATFSLTR